MSERKRLGEYDLLKIDCTCGRCFYMALSRKFPAKFGLGTDREEAIARLVAKLREMRGGKPQVPDFLPPDF